MTKNIASTPAYQEWFSEQKKTRVSDARIKKLVTADIEQGKSMSQQEYTLWQNWQNIQREFEDADKQKGARFGCNNRTVFTDPG